MKRHKRSPAAIRVSAEQIAGLRAAAGAQWRPVVLGGLSGRRERLAAIAAALNFPAHFGMNLDALYDALTDLPSGCTVWLDGLGDDEDAQALLKVFDDAVAEAARSGRELRVYC